MRIGKTNPLFAKRADQGRDAKSRVGDPTDGPMRPLGWVADERRDRW